jgi:hypothetical protein
VCAGAVLVVCWIVWWLGGAGWLMVLLVDNWFVEGSEFGDMQTLAGGGWDVLDHAKDRAELIGSGLGWLLHPETDTP